MTAPGRRPQVDLPDPQDWEPELRRLVGESEGDLVGLLLAVDETFGFLPRNVLARLSEWTGVPLVRIHGVATFYARFRLEPRGRRTLAVCRGTACHVAGAESVLDVIARRLGVVPGGTTVDGEVTLETVACVGCCSLAPVVVVDGATRGRLRLRDVGTLVGELKGASA